MQVVVQRFTDSELRRSNDVVDGKEVENVVLSDDATLAELVAALKSSQACRPGSGMSIRIDGRIAARTATVWPGAIKPDAFLLSPTTPLSDLRPGNIEINDYLDACVIITGYILHT